ncbi:MAG: SDR family NAD(P)-dependent oxidoreductase [Desulfosarcina sp.]
MAVSGGVDTINDGFMHMCFAKSGVLSHSGDARPFSADADGTVLGEGIGILVLKRLVDAERDGDRIYAVIRGIGSSSDGKSQSIYAPRAEGQVRALMEAYRSAGISPQTVELIEAHGTGTRVGDEVEFSALKNVFGAADSNGNRCALGSVKSMIGHTKAAAGAAGLIKSALSLHTKVILPTLKTGNPDPKLELPSSPFYLSTAARPWFSNNRHPRRGGVSSFGFGGSNFHVVLEEYGPHKTEVAWDGSVEIAAFSGPDADAITNGLHEFARLIGDPVDASLLARTARRRRSDFSTQSPWRLVMVVETSLATDQLKRTIQTALGLVAAGQSASLPDPGIYFSSTMPEPATTAFMFPGQGSQYPHMGRDLVCCFPGAMQAIQTAGRPVDGSRQLWEIIFPEPATSDDQRRQQTDDLRRTEAAQPAIGAVSLAMLSVLDYFNVRPDATCGHSYGELPALHAAGWIDQETLAALSTVRGRLMAAVGKDVDAGTMLAVKAPIDALAALVEPLPDVVLANLNSPDQGVLSGSTTAIASAKNRCAENGYSTVSLPVSAAFHSPLMQGARQPFSEAVAKAAFTPPRIPVYANVTAAPYPADPSGATDLLTRQLTSPVRFKETIEGLFNAGVRSFVEVGPKTVLRGLVRSILNGKNVTTIALDRSSGRSSGILDLAHALGQLAILGVEVDLKRWESEPPAARVQKMSVPLSGANYRPPRETGSEPAAAVAARAPAPNAPAAIATQPGSDSTPSMEPDLPMNTTAPTQLPIEPAVQPNSTRPAATANLDDALAIVQKGLESIQLIQQQTAQVHQKFLESQIQANRTVQEMMQSTRLWVGATPNASSIPPMAEIQTPTAGPEADISQPLTTDRSRPVQADTFAAPAAGSQTVAPDALSSAPPPSGHVPAIAAEAISKTLLDVVSELTGYPGEMLGLQMDIEADLGIDSIKRVEILSAMETRMPHLPQVTPDKVGSLKTLGQICDFLSRQAALAPAAVATTPQGPDPATKPKKTMPKETMQNQTIHQTLLDIVSELTGYPGEMLGLEMDIEADLGIDSIKRVEILSAMETRMPHLPQVTPDRVGSLKTLGQIGDYLSNGQKGSTAPIHDSCPTARASSQEVPSQTLPRRIVDAVASPKTSGRPLRIAPTRWIAVVGDETALTRALMAQLNGKALTTRRVSSDKLNRTACFDGAAGLILLDPIDSESAFVAARQACSELIDASDGADALFVAVTRMDGAFGFTGNAFDNPEQGALSGLVKTAALEWPSVVCRAIDLCPSFSDPDAAARRIAAELLTVCEDDPVEIGLSPDRRVTLATVPAEACEGSIHLSSDDVVVVTGGARGVTAACALALAREVGVSIALIGRSAPPVAMPDWLRDVQGEAAMKKVIAESDFNGAQPTPTALEAAYRRYTANRAIARSIAELEASGVRTAYFCADVTDRDGLKRAVDAIRHQMGPIAGLIHGAGVLHDRLIADKPVDQFRQVYATKVTGLSNLLAATEADPLRHLVLFSSVAARTGNMGQCDYAMANEALNKMARVEALRRDGCRVTAINWGPWDGGMVTPSLKKVLDGRNLTLIPIQVGARLMVAEMKNADPGNVEVLIGSMLNDEKTPLVDSPESPMVLLERRELDLDRYPVLAAHVIGGKPVVPFALISEWIGHGALKENPGFSLHGIDDFRLLSGIRIDQERKLVRLMASKARKAGDAWQVDVELRNGVKNGKDVIHSRARALLVDRYPAAPVFKGNGKNGRRAYPRKLDAVYGQILFHGELLRAIQAIEDYSDQGMTARLTSAPKPEAWMEDPIRGCWMADPMVLDGAFQMAIAWCFEQTGKVCLPSYARAFRQYRPAFPTDGVTAVMAVTDHSHRRLMADFTFLDATDQVVATLSGYEATVDESLMHAFGKNGLGPVFKGKANDTTARESQP